MLCVCKFVCQLVARLWQNGKRILYENKCIENICVLLLYHVIFSRFFIQNFSTVMVYSYTRTYIGNFKISLHTSAPFKNYIVSLFEILCRIFIRIYNIQQNMQCYLLFLEAILKVNDKWIINRLSLNIALYFHWYMPAVTIS